MSTFLKDFLAQIGIPEAHIPPLLAYAEQMIADPRLAPLVRRFLAHDFANNRDILNEASAIGAGCGAHPYTAQWLFHAIAAEPLLANYRAAGVDEAIYWDSMRDLGWKYRECREVHQIPGSFVADWFERFFHMTRFALGRLQFEHIPFWEGCRYAACGVTLQEGDDVINIHIPSAGPLTKESRMDAYRRAYAFFAKDFPSGILPIVCGSWLLYPKHREFLPEGSNILSFMEDFDPVASFDRDPFPDAWRIFGNVEGKPLEIWPEDTRLRRAYKNWLLSGHTGGYGRGVLLFDGEKILNAKN